MNLALDKAGRVVLPKAVRDALRLEAGDALRLESDGERIVLQSVRRRAPLRKEHGIWAYQGEATQTPIDEIVDRIRVDRLKDLAR